MIVFRTYYIPNNQKQKSPLQLQCIINTTKVMRCFKINKLKGFRITSSCPLRMKIYIEKPYEKLYMINVIDLHIPEQQIIFGVTG